MMLTMLCYLCCAAAIEIMAPPQHPSYFNALGSLPAPMEDMVVSQLAAAGFAVRGEDVPRDLKQVRVSQSVNQQSVGGTTVLITNLTIIWSGYIHRSTQLSFSALSLLHW